MRLPVLVLLLTVAFVTASAQTPRDAGGRGRNRGRSVGGVCRRSGGIFLPHVRGCRGCGACVKFLGLGEPCTGQGNSTGLPQPVCDRNLRCDPGTKRCVPLPAPATATNSTPTSIMIIPRCGRRRPCFECFCQRSKRPKLDVHSAWYNAYTNPTLHRMYR